MNLPVLSLDLATKTGWALLDRSGVITSGVQEFDLRRGESKGMRFLRFRKWLKEVLSLGEIGEQFSKETPGLIVYEQPHFRGGHACELLVGFSTNVLAEAALFGLEHLAVHTGSLKKYATTKGNAGKEEMIAKAKELFPDIEIIDDNHADALLLLKYGLSEIGIS
jgi:Holliday junction resolvasome RuvABC endonuclease subunit